MVIHLHEATHSLAEAIRAVKAGDMVAITEGGIPVAVMQPLRPASKQEEKLIREMIASGQLEPVQKSGAVREWKWKRVRTKAA